MPIALPKVWRPRQPAGSAGSARARPLRINLLPPALRPTPNPFRRMVQGPAVALVIIGCLAIYAVLVLAVGALQHRLDRLNAQAGRLSPQQASVAALQGQIGELNGRLQQLSAVAHQRRRWADKLNQLSDLLPEQVWFNQLQLEPTQTLKINGTVLAPAGEEVPIINRLVNALKAHRAFSVPFQEIAVESVRRRQIQEMEVADFTLLCVFAK